MKTGKVPENVLKRSVLRHLKTERKELLNGAGIGKDCAVFSFSDRNVVSCMQEASVAVRTSAGCRQPGYTVRYTMAQLIQKCANNLAAAGAEPVTAMITLLLPENTEESELKNLMAEAEQKCRELSMDIAGGQTRITADVSSPIAVVTGFGRGPEDTGDVGHMAGIASPGQDIVISKWIGLEGTAFLAERCSGMLHSRYPAYLVEEAAGFHRYLSILPEAATAVESGVCAMHDASEGGIFGALWELAEGSGVGLTIDLKKIPLRQETVEVCECCNVNPYQLLSGGCLVMATEDGPGLVDGLTAIQIPAVIVGKVTDRNDRILLNGEEVRYMDRPATDELYRFLSESSIQS